MIGIRIIDQRRITTVFHNTQCHSVDETLIRHTCLKAVTIVPCRFYLFMIKNVRNGSTRSQQTTFNNQKWQVCVIINVKRMRQVDIICAERQQRVIKWWTQNSSIVVHYFWPNEFTSLEADVADTCSSNKGEKSVSNREDWWAYLFYLLNSKHGVQ